MDIILKQDIPKLGYTGDTVSVKPGYARNYLIPQGIALLATPSAKKMMAENQRQAAHKLARLKENAESTARQMEALNLQVPTKVGTSGKIFGSITTQLVSNLLKQQGFEIDRRRIDLPKEMRMVGAYTITIDLHKEVKAQVPVEIVSEDKQKPAS